MNKDEFIKIEIKNEVQLIRKSAIRIISINTKKDCEEIEFCIGSKYFTYYRSVDVKAFDKLYSDISHLL